MRKKYAGWLFVLPGLFGVVIFYLIPFLDVVRRSFYKVLGGFCGMENYSQVWNNEAFRLAAANTVKFAVVCLPLLLGLSLGIAVLLMQTGKAMELLKSVYLIPLAIPAASIALLFQILFDANGMINGILETIGITANDWMNTKQAFNVLVGTYIWKNMGYVVVLWLAAMSEIPVSLYEAAKMDGAGSRAVFWYITLPQIRQAAFTIIVISFLNTFKVFREAYLVAGNYPHESIYLLQHLFNNWFLSLSVDKMAAAAVMLAILVCALVQILMKFWEGE